MTGCDDQPSLGKSRHYAAFIPTFIILFSTIIDNAMQIRDNRFHSSVSFQPKRDHAHETFQNFRCDVVRFFTSFVCKSFTGVWSITTRREKWRISRTKTVLAGSSATSVPFITSNNRELKNHGNTESHRQNVRPEKEDDAQTVAA